MALSTHPTLVAKPQDWSLSDITVDDARQLVQDSRTVLETYRRHCHRLAFDEHSRTTLVSRHDPSIRFTNSTISVLKPLLSQRPIGRHFLAQPALRLRNLNHVRRTQTMSPFGCYFIAFGALVAPTDTALLVQLCQQLCAELGFADDAVRFNAFDADDDLIDLAEQGNVRVERFSDDAPFRHHFGLPDVRGRNINLCLRGPDGSWADTANIITLQRPGNDAEFGPIEDPVSTIAVELAFGVNMVLRQWRGVGHSALAGPGATAAAYGCRNLIAVDALHSCIALAIDGLEPRSRGRGGNYRQLLRLLDQYGPTEPSHRRNAIDAVAAAELELRASASPATAGDARPDADQVTARLLADLTRVCRA